MTTLTAIAPAVVKRIEYSPLDHDYAAFVAIDGEPEQYLGSQPTQIQADALCDEYAYHYYIDHHTPEVAARIAATAFDPGPPVDDDIEDNFGGFRPTTDDRRPTTDDQAYLDALDGKAPWPAPSDRPAAKVNWSEAAAHLARLHRTAAARRTQPAPVADDTSAIIAELALTDPCALAEFLRGHSAVQRDQLAWRFTSWLRRHHGIVREPAQIAACWTGLLRDTEKSAVEAQRPDAGAAIVRQWTTDRQDFLQVLSQLDEAGICQMAEAAVAFHRKHGSDLTVDQQLAAWQEAAVEAQQCAEAGA